MITPNFFLINSASLKSLTVVRIMRSRGCFRVVLKRHDLLSRESKTSTTSIIKINMSNLHSFWQCGRVNRVVVVLAIYISIYDDPRPLEKDKILHGMIKDNDLNS